MEEEDIYIFPEEYYVRKNIELKDENLIGQDVNDKKKTKYGNITIEDTEFKNQ